MKKNFKYEDAIDVEYEAASVEEIDHENNDEDCDRVVAVVVKECRVVSYNPFSGVIVYDRDGELVQATMPDYDGSGVIYVE